MREQAHARKRFSERLGINFGPQRKSQIVKAIQSGQAEFVYRQSGRVTHWLVDIDGQKVKVVYDSARKEIVTVLTNAAGIK